MRIIGVVLVVVGAVLGFVVPSFWGELNTAGVDIGFKSAARTVQCSLKAVLRMTGFVLVALSILCFLTRNTKHGIPLTLYVLRLTFYVPPP